MDRRDAHAAAWRVRRETYGHLLRRCFAHAPQQVRVLDLGAGCGWLSHRLAALGHRPVSVDLLDDETDGLGVVKYYGVRFAAVQADFNRLPFAPEQFDVVVFNESLHYAANAAATLGHARRVLAPGGALVVMDSPMRASFGADLTSAAAALGLDAAFVESRGPLVRRLRRRLSLRAAAARGLWVAQ